jgi:hypothetical protein
MIRFNHENRDSDLRSQKNNVAISKNYLEIWTKGGSLPNADKITIIADDDVAMRKILKAQREARLAGL